jgi:VanZ family protein
VTQPPGSPLARYLLAAYTFLVVYASLHPLAGWTSRGANPLAFLQGPLPRHFTLFDVVTNGLAYLPFGFLCVLAVYPHRRGWSAALVAVLGGVFLSGSLEALQTYLPTRVASNLDFQLNVIGTVVGATCGAIVAPHVLSANTLLAGRRAWFRPGARIDAGIVLIALWLFGQMNPDGFLFGMGKIYGLVEVDPSTQLPAELFIRVEAAVSAAHLVAMGLFVGALVNPNRPLWLVVVTVVVVGLAVRTGAFAMLFAPKNALDWITPGAWRGLAIGIVVLLLASRLSLRMRVSIATFVLIAATVLVNVAPDNPYTVHALQVWRQGHFLNFHGLTGIVAMAWPFLALAYVIALMVGAIRTSRDLDD